MSGNSSNTDMSSNYTLDDNKSNDEKTRDEIKYDDDTQIHVKTINDIRKELFDPILTNWRIENVVNKLKQNKEVIYYCDNIISEIYFNYFMSSMIHKELKYVSRDESDETYKYISKIVKLTLNVIIQLIKLNKRLEDANKLIDEGIEYLVFQNTHYKFGDFTTHRKPFDELRLVKSLMSENYIKLRDIQEELNKLY
jgi:hypothetical protein